MTKDNSGDTAFAATTVETEQPMAPSDVPTSSDDSSKTVEHFEFRIPGMQKLWMCCGQMNRFAQAVVDGTLMVGAYVDNIHDTIFMWLDFVARRKRGRISLT